MEEDDYLVPGRECGSCTACCKDLAIVEDGMNKLPGIACEHCTEGQGCAIYETRPRLCRSFHCLWRSLPTMDDSWRPDLSGILMMVTGELPPDFPGHFGVDLILTGPLAALDTDRFAGMVGGFVESGTAAYLTMLPAPGCRSYRGFLNPLLEPAIAARDLAAVKQLIRNCHDALKAQPAIPATPGDMDRSRSPEGWTLGD